MKAIVTTGPSFEPIDEVRRLTNFSTGESGIRLASHLANCGHEVFCLKGLAATFSDAPENCRLASFTTNDDLLGHLTSIGREHKIGAVFHVAALCDFKVKAVANAEGGHLQMAKIDSRVGDLTIQLEPARKIIGELRELFPNACLVGWKYELNGTRNGALEKAWRQLRENRTDACVLNGRAYGSGFAFCTLPDAVTHFQDREALLHFLSGWLNEKKPTV